MRSQTNVNRLEQDLEAYAAASRSIAANLRDRLGSWPIYAAAAASALACSTSASAGIIYYSVNETISPTHTSCCSSKSVFRKGSLEVSLPGGDYLSLRINHGTTYSHSQRGNVSGTRRPRASFLDSAVDPLKNLRLAPNATISADHPGGTFERGQAILWVERNGAHSFNWGPANPTTAFAGFRFSTLASDGIYYGWLHISISADGGGYPETMTLIDYAYNDVSGQSIEAGEGAVPEPATRALMLLATGFAGVLAWRRRKAA